MTNIAKGLYLASLLSLSMAQITATFLDRNFWPIASFNVFSRAIDGDFWIVKVTLVDDDGNRLLVDPGETLPVEFFKARSIFQKVFLSAKSPGDKDEFSRRVLSRLNERRWYGFDETMPPAGMSRAVQLTVEAWQLSPVRLDDETGFRRVKKLILYVGPSALNAQSSSTVGP